MKNAVGIVLGLVAGVLVWAFAASVLSALAMWRPADGAGALVPAVVAAAMATPAWLIAAVIFFGLAALLMGFSAARYRFGSIGTASAVLFLIASWALWFFGVASPHPALFGAFPSAEVWGEMKAMWFSGDESPELLGRHTLLPIAILLAGGFGGWAYGRVVRALGGGRRRVARAVTFG